MLYGNKTTFGGSNRFPACPTLTVPELTIWGMWVTLSKTRSFGGFGPSPISLQSIVVYLDFYGFYDQRTREEYFELVVEMDSEYLKVWVSQNRTK